MTDVTGAVEALGHMDLNDRAHALGMLVGQGIAQALASPPVHVPPGTLVWDAWVFSVLGVASRTMMDAQEQWIAEGHKPEDAVTARMTGSMAVMMQVRLADVTAMAGGAAH
ncbi:hypothetical protein [Enterovirga rhinocerotis]|uniref:Uncharacterized protein n=1 Tax=Enterovirga rhinocerotis TaxID=1339210 RepID=A0A4R7BTP0_9HYPH|nr:hypothetical protein [Enterovirga rhinocerotis]TDR89114.1 hypothetical protein EV668_3602 [Enterovirga rhinocerotis]